MLGWEEWLALPDLGLPAIKAKVDTGARTSALHAFSLDVFGPNERPKVRFGVHPVPGRDDIAVYCTADVIDRREVTSSNGERESRLVIASRVQMGDRAWPIEITLANRETMAYRMLLGRQAILDDMFVDPAASFRQPRLSYKVYGQAMRSREEGTPRPLQLALMSRRPDNASNRRLVRAGERRGHRVSVVDRTRLSLYIDARDPAIFLDGRPMPCPDAVIARTSGALSAFSLATLRQMEGLGAWVVNPAAALVTAADPIAQRQALAFAGVAVPDAAVSHADLLKGAGGEAHVLADSRDVLAAGPLLRFAVAGGRALAGIARDPTTLLDEAPAWRTARPDELDEAASRLAEAAARALGLGLAAVDVVMTRQGALVTEVSPNLSIAQIERLSDAALAEAVIVQIELGLRHRRPVGQIAED